MASVKIGSQVTTPGNTAGKVVARQEFGKDDDGNTPTPQVLVQWTDAAGNQAQNWFEESDVTVS